MKTSLLFLFILLSGCGNKQSQEVTSEFKVNEQFWKNRNTMSTLNQTEKYPIVKDTLLSEERTNRIYLRSAQCQFEVFVDDVILLKVMGEVTKSGAGITGSYDINQLILTSGKHEIKVRMYPMYGLTVFNEKTPDLQLTLSHFRDRDLRTVSYTEDMNGYNGIELNGSDKQWIEKYDENAQVGYDGEYQPKTPIKFNGLPIYEWRSTFNAEVPFDFIGWRESINLKEVYKNKQEQLELELFEAYKKIHKIIGSKNTADYLNLVKEREKLIMSCLYYRENEKPMREAEFIDLIKSEDYELLPLVKESSKVEYQAYGNLVMFLHKIDGEGIIRLKNKEDSDDTIFMEFKFHKKTKEAQLTII